MTGYKDRLSQLDQKIDSEKDIFRNVAAGDESGELEMEKKVTMLTVKLLDNFFHNIISFSGIFHLCRELVCITVKWTWYNGRDKFFHITSGRINTWKGVNQLKELFFLNLIIFFKYIFEIDKS